MTIDDDALSCLLYSTEFNINHNYLDKNYENTGTVYTIHVT